MPLAFSPDTQFQKSGTFGPNSAERKGCFSPVNIGWKRVNPLPQPSTVHLQDNLRHSDATKAPNNETDACRDLPLPKTWTLPGNLYPSARQSLPLPSVLTSAYPAEFAGHDGQIIPQELVGACVYVTVWVAQATGLFRPATRRTEWEGQSLGYDDGLLRGAALLVPVGESPTGTGGSPVLPILHPIHSAAGSLLPRILDLFHEHRV